MRKLTITRPQASLTPEQRQYMADLAGAIAQAHASVPFAHCNALCQWLEREHHSPRLRTQTNAEATETELQVRTRREAHATAAEWTTALAVTLS